MPKLKITKGSGNVFADIGLENADELLAKAELASLINQEIRDRGYTQSMAAEVLGIDQPRVSALQRGRLHLFSFEKLARLNFRLGNAVEIAVKRATVIPSSISVKAVTAPLLLMFWQGHGLAASTADLYGKVSNRTEVPISAKIFSKAYAVNTRAATFNLESLDVQIPHPGAVMYARNKELHL